LRSNSEKSLTEGAAKTGETYFFNGGISHVPLEAETPKEDVAAQALPGIYESERLTPSEERQPMVEESLPQNNLLWIIIPIGIIILLVIIVLYIAKKK